MGENSSPNLSISVPQILIQGNLFDVWVENREFVGLEGDLKNVLLRVDKFGFFIFWQHEGKEGDAIDLSQINDIVLGEPPTDKKAVSILVEKHGAEVFDKIIRIKFGIENADIKHLYAVCADSEIAQQWMKELQKLSHNIKMKYLSPLSTLKKQFIKLRHLVDENGKIQVKEVAKSFSLNKINKAVYQHLSKLELPNNKYDSIRVEEFTFEKFFDLYKKLCVRDEVDAVYKTLIKRKPDYISLDKFNKFLTVKQGYKFDKEASLKIMKMYEPNSEANAKNLITKGGFLQYLLSDQNTELSRDVYDVYMDMARPLSEYYVNTSCLNAEKSPATIQLYRKILLSGCRSIEIHCFDGKNAEPVVTWKAAETEVLFRNVIYAVRDTAFVSSDYPVIVTLENNCSKLQQYKIAKYLVDVLGNMLLKAPLTEYPLEEGGVPSPELLKRKILINGKKLPLEVESIEFELFRKHFYTSEGKSNWDIKEWSQLDTKLHVHPWLSTLVNYAEMVPFSSFEEFTAHHNRIIIANTPEATAENLLANRFNNYIAFNKKYITRVHPDRSQTQSGKYSPQKFWRAGCQMVGVTFQNENFSNQLNRTKFETNGNCGYLLKPDGTNPKWFKFSVSVISGQFVSDKKVGTFVEVSVVPAGTDEEKVYRTEVSFATNGNTKYEGKQFNFGAISLPDGMLRFGVYEKHGGLLSQRILPVQKLNWGYRHIALRNEENFPIGLATLFCYLEIKS